jgi:hypothetical protein
MGEARKGRTKEGDGSKSNRARTEGKEERKGKRDNDQVSAYAKTASFILFSGVS